MLVHPSIRILRGPRPDYAWLPAEAHRDVVMLTAAALRHPSTLPEMCPGHGARFDARDEETMVAKIELLLAAARRQGCTHLVVGAWGCGAYGNPPLAVAALFKRVLRARGAAFVRIVFAIVGDGNFEPFRKVLLGVGPK
jgi:hypothetical protein